MNRAILSLFSIVIILPIFAQPISTADFNHRSSAMGGCDVSIIGEGNFPDIFDISDGNNPSASHFSRLSVMPVEMIDKIGGIDKFNLDLSFRTLEYPGPRVNDEDRSWYWVEGISRILIEKGVTNSFSVRFLANGGYSTIRKSWQDYFAPGIEYRHNYSASLPNWSSLRNRAVTMGGTAMVPLSEFYLAYHSFFGLSLSGGGGFSFSEYEDMSYDYGWQTNSKGSILAYKTRFGGRYVHPDYPDYAGIGLSFGMDGGKVMNEKDEDYDMFKSSEPLYGIQAELGYPRFFKGAIGYEAKNIGEKFYSTAGDTTPLKNRDKITSIAINARATGDGIEIPVAVGFKMKNIATKGTIESDPVLPKESLRNNDIGVGISVYPLVGLTFAGEYENSNWSYEKEDEDPKKTVLKTTKLRGGIEVFPVSEFGIRLGFENFNNEPDSMYKVNFGNYIHSFIDPSSRYDYVPEIEKGNVLTGGFVLRLDDERLLIELSAKHYFSGGPEVYNNEKGNRNEGHFGMTYYLK